MKGDKETQWRIEGRRRKMEGRDRLLWEVIKAGEHGKKEGELCDMTCEGRTGRNGGQIVSISFLTGVS